MTAHSVTSRFVGPALAGWFLMVALAAPAAAADTRIIEHEGGSVLFHVLQQADPDGVLHGALEFRNEAGWKTYWRDPGPSGIPPNLEISIDGSKVDTEIRFPHPAWITDEYSTYAGYVGPISLPFEIRLDTPLPDNAQLDAFMFAGVCREICIPVSGTFTLSADDGIFRSAITETMAVNKAMSVAPQRVQSDQVVTEAWQGPDNVIVSFAEAVDIDDVFVALIGDRAGKSVIVSKPQDTSADGRSLVLTLANDDGPFPATAIHIAARLDGRSVETVLPASRIKSGSN